MELNHTIGEVARATGLSPAAIRFYEARGVLPEVERGPSGYRAYTKADLDLVRFVARLRALELPLRDVREIVALRSENMAPCAEVRASIDRELERIESRISDLNRLRAELTDLREQARDLPDEWPTACICNVLEGARR